MGYLAFSTGAAFDSTYLPPVNSDGYQGNLPIRDNNGNFIDTTFPQSSSDGFVNIGNQNGFKKPDEGTIGSSGVSQNNRFGLNDQFDQSNQAGQNNQVGQNNQFDQNNQYSQNDQLGQNNRLDQNNQGNGLVQTGVIPSGQILTQVSFYYV